MKYRKLGNTGLSVSTLTLGTMGFGTETPEDESFAIIDSFLDAGGNMLDTANVYGGGISENLLGRWRKSRPRELTDRVVTASKARFGVGPDANDAGTSRRHLHRALDASLRRLGVECIDLYQMHGWDPITPIEETLCFLDTAVRAGKIHYIGLSNFTGWQLQLAVSKAKEKGLVLPATLQQQYSLVCREIEYEVVPVALHNNLGLLPWSPLAHGFLSGKFERTGEVPADTRLGSDNAMYAHVWREIAKAERNWATIDTVREVAKEIAATPSQVALSWVTDRAGVSSTIIGGRTMAHVTENLGAANLVLPDKAVARLDAVSAPQPDDYPYGRFGVLQRDRYIDSSDQALRELAQ